MRTLIILLVCLFFFAPKAEATCSTQTVEFSGTHIVFTNDCSDDNELMIQTTDMTKYDGCFVMSTTGAVDVLVSLDGTNYATAALSLQDYGATTTGPVLLTVAARVYGFMSKFRRIRILQNGATDAAASLLCWSN